MKESILFFVRYPKINGFENNHIQINFKLWVPINIKIPKGIQFFKFLIWILLHYFKFFKSSNFAINCYYVNSKLVHTATVFPAFFRFPFMGKDDIQFGDIWTHESFQNNGIAKKSILYLTNIFFTKKIWFLCKENNYASIKVAKNSGFVLYGIGYKKNSFLNLFSTYLLTKKL